MRFIFVVAATLSSSALAVTGSEAFDWHQRSSNNRSVPLMAYIRGALDGERAFEEVFRARSQRFAAFGTVWLEMQRSMFCPPSGADVRQAYDLVVRSLQSNPEDRHEDLAIHVRMALREAWPCKP
jgi:hypothetical protein